MHGMQGVLPSCFAIVEGSSLAGMIHQNGKLVYKSQAQVVEPSEIAGQMLFDDFWVGVDEDPEAQEEDTWKRFGASRLFSMLEAAGLDMNDIDDEELPGLYQGRRYKVSIQYVKNPDVNPDGSPHKYAGAESNKVKRYFPQDEGPEPQILPQAGGTPTVKKGIPPAKPAPAPAPKAAPKAAAAPKADKPKAAAPSAQIACTVCGDKLDLADFPAHVAEKHSED